MAKLEVSNLIDMLRKRAFLTPDRCALNFLDNGDGPDLIITYAELDHRARSVAAKMQKMNLSGERILLPDTGLDFLISFMGCVYAHAIAVPVSLPQGGVHLVERLQAIAQDASAALTLASEQTLDLISKASSAISPLLSLESIPPDIASQWQQPEISPDDLAYLQYTSGSTNVPKGVMISHHNVLYDMEDICLAVSQNSESVAVSWLPTFHDFGLVFGLLTPIYCGCLNILFNPIGFIQRPVRWLQAISQYRGTHSGAPNFAYDYCVQKITPEECVGLDLSSWLVTVNGSEPIHSETLKRFATAFAPLGFKMETFSPGYGLAEATLKVTVSEANKTPVFFSADPRALSEHRVALTESLPPGFAPLVGCGHTILENRMEIVDPTTMRRCAADKVGEIWLAGPIVAKGYWNKPEDTQATFQAYLENGEGPFLRSGDYGFIQENEVFITGRLKDLVIIRGRNHYPQDIEETTLRSGKILRPGACVAFSIPRIREEGLAVVAGLKKNIDPAQADFHAVVASIRQALSEVHEIQATMILIVQGDSVPHTSSGKLKRGYARKLFVNPDGSYKKNNPALYFAWEEPLEEIDVEKDLAPGNFNAEDAVAWLVKWLAMHLGLKEGMVDKTTAFADVGLDSLKAVELSNDLQRWVGAELLIETTITWNYTTIQELAQYLVSLPALPVTTEADIPPADGKAKKNANEKTDMSQQDAHILELLEKELEESRRRRKL